MSNSTAISIFSKTIGKKLIMALTGLFLIIFLVAHMLGNFLLFADDGGLAFNEYTKFMTSTPYITVMSYVTYIAIILHVVYSIILTRQNRKSRPVSYAYNKSSQNSLWNSRNMGVLGFIVLLFLVIHLKSFWYELKFGSVPMMANSDLKDIYSVVVEAFSHWWYVAIYLISMVGLAYHLAHGFQSAFQTFGFNHKAYTPVLKNIGMGIAVLIPSVFAFMAIYMYIQS